MNELEDNLIPLKEYLPITVLKKISTPTLYTACDSNYFYDWTRLFIASAKEKAPNINLHCHIFDIQERDINWCRKFNISYSYENTPEYFKTFEEKKAYWVNVRFCRITEIFEDYTPVLNFDSDGIMVNKLELTEFIKDLSVDWVAMREKGYGSLGGSVGFSPNGELRHLLKEKLINTMISKGPYWYLDQILLNKFVEDSKIQPFSMKYVDYHCREESVIWVGKGSRKFVKEGKKRKLPPLIEKYKKRID